MKKPISILLINPWITDFAAYNLWAEPLGLYYIASILRNAGAEVHFVNCLRSLTKKEPEPKQNGCGKYLRTVIEKPAPLRFVRRNYACYGIDEDEFEERLKATQAPDAVLLTSHMTYWYPGVFKTINIVKRVYGKRVPVVLGGIYTTLCRDHASRFSGADFIFTEKDLSKLIPLLTRITGKILFANQKLEVFADYPEPDHRMHEGYNYIAVLTGRGCPFRCSYCAAPLLNSGISRKSILSVVQEIHTHTRILGAHNVAFYDDALLADAEHHIIPIIEKTTEIVPGVSYHLPNGVHAGFVTARIARLFYAAGFQTIRIGFETANRELQNKTGKKTTNSEFRYAVAVLREAGFSQKAIGTYIMAGLPGQTAKDVENSIDFVYRAGASPYLSYFSPIPGTAIWKDAVEHSCFPVEREPLLQNNSVFILGNSQFSEATVQHLKDSAAALRKAPS
jgi:radical SAM superfamily enzyme YgiQ (UPF0313 family)